MGNDDITIIVGVEAQGTGKRGWEAETTVTENARRTGADIDGTLQSHLDTSHPLETSNSETSPNVSKAELKRTKELILHSGSSRGFAESPSPSKLNLKSSQAVYCVSNHLAKTTFHSSSTSEQAAGAANSTSTIILQSRGNPLMVHPPVKPTNSSTPARTNNSSHVRLHTSTFLSASTPCIPSSLSTNSTTITADPTSVGSSTPPTGIIRTRTSASASALSFFRSLKSALKGKGKAKDKRRTLSFPPEFLNLGGGSPSKSTASLPHTNTIGHSINSIHLPISSIFHGLRHGYKPVRSPTDGVLRMLPAPVIVTHSPSLSPASVPPPASEIKRKRDIWKYLKPGNSSQKSLQKHAASGNSLTTILEEDDTPSVLDLGHIPLPSPLLYETCTIAPPNPCPKYTVTIHLAHPGQKLEYEMDSMTGHLLIIVYTPHCGFSTISGVIGGGSSRPATSGYDDDDDDDGDGVDDVYGYETASRAGGIWIPQLFDWNGLRVLDWGSVSGKVVFQFPAYVRLARSGGEEWYEREVMPPDMSEEVVEVELNEMDIDACVIKEGKWDEKGKGKGKAAPEPKAGSKKKGKGKEIVDSAGATGKLGGRYDYRPRPGNSKSQ